MNTELSRMGLQFNTEEWLQVNCTGPQIIAEIPAIMPVLVLRCILQTRLPQRAMCLSILVLRLSLSH